MQFSVKSDVICTAVLLQREKKLLGFKILWYTYLFNGNKLISLALTGSLLTFWRFTNRIIIIIIIIIII